jgi:hypothetical protein
MNDIKYPIFFSFDLCDSAKIKQKIGKNNQILQIYYSKLVEFEISFYELLSGNRFENLSFDKLYLIKTIGDEYWYLYLAKTQIEVSEFLNVVHQLSQKKPEKYSSSYKVICGEEHNDLIKHEYKFYIDKLEIVNSFSNIRLNKVYEFLLRKVDSGVIPKLDSVENNEYTAHKYLETIGLSHVMKQEGFKSEGINNNIFSYRFDPIGLEVDRFFRCAKKIKTPMRVHIGEALYKELEIHEKSQYEVIRKFKPKGLNKKYKIYRLI